MKLDSSHTLGPPDSSVLQAYLLGSVDFESALAFQRRLVYQVSGERTGSFLVVCEHPPQITVGRQGSRTHILFEPEELACRQWRVRWVNRGGGCLLHMPGQMAAYSILPLDRFQLGLRDYLDRLQKVVIAVLDDFGIRGESRRGQPGVWVGGRPIAHVGVAVRDWVSYYGVALNINPPLGFYRQVRFSAATDSPMTSLERERRGPLRAALVRERFLEHFADRFSFVRTTLFSDHPSLSRKASADAIASHY
jgi:lipoyl(octanoyl) transferase